MSRPTHGPTHRGNARKVNRSPNSQLVVDALAHEIDLRELLGLPGAQIAAALAGNPLKPPA